MSAEPKTWDVFLVYSTEDLAIIQKIVCDLQKQEMTCWLDEEQIQPDDPICETIENGLRASYAILPCFSRNQLQSGWSRAEYTAILRQYFSERTQPKIYPLLLDDVQKSQLPGFLQKFRWTRYSEQKRYKKLLEMLKKQRLERSSHQKYQITAEDLNRIQNGYKKAQEYHHSDPAACLTTARRIAEDICKQVLRAETPGPSEGLMLYKLINKLTTEQVMPHTIAAPLMVIQNYGNVGAHPQGKHAKHLTPDYVRPCIESLGTVVRWYLERYPLPAFHDQATPEPQKEHIRNLIPRFIHDQCQQGNVEGNFEALTMFVGFTAMAGTLAQHGLEGAEVLAEVMNKVFHLLVEAVYEQSGFISVFAGDALTAIFPKESEAPGDTTILHGLACTEKIQSIFLHHGIHKTSFGQFDLQFKAGLSYGNVNWDIAGKTSKAYFFRGEAIEACAKTEKQAARGDIIFDERLARQLGKIQGVSGGDWRMTKLESGAYQLHEIPQTLKPRFPSPELSQQEPLRQEILAQFLPERVLAVQDVGEFRNIAPVFIGFQGDSSDEAFHAWSAVLLEHVNAYGGYLSQFGVEEKGDTVLCIFGAPVGVEDPIDRALDCLWGVKQKLKASKPLAGLQFRAGVAYGMAYAGIVGGEQQCVYTCYSEIINVAARLAQHANWGDVLVSEEVRAKTELFSFRQAGAVLRAGFSAPIPAYSVFRRKYGVRRRAFSETLVGRQRELRQLHRCLAPIFDGECAGVLYVYGEAGIGKSHLTDTLRQEVAAAYDVNWFLCPVDQVFRKPLNPFITFLSGYFELSPELPEEQNKAKFEEIYLATLDDLLTAPQEEITAGSSGFTRAQGEHLRAELLRTKSIIGAQLGLFWEGSLWEALDPKGKHENTLNAIKSFFLAQSLFNPTVIEIEDGHGLDNDSREVLDALTRHVKYSPAPILILCTSRYNDDGSRPNFGLQEVFEQALPLDYLSESDIKDQAEAELHGPISDAVHTLLAEKTHGNPFFVQQMLRYFQEEGLIVQHDQQWRLTQDRAIVPDSIQNILIARLGRLSEEVKEAVKTAAVIGREFEIQLLSAVLKKDLRDNDPILLEAWQAKIWDIYKQILVIFKHALFQDAAYQMLLNARRKELHHITAEAIETLYRDKDKLELYFVDLALHYEKAENTNKAIEYLEKAGDQAKAQYQNQQALNFYDRLLVQLRSTFGFPELEIETLLQKAEILELIGEWKTCQQVCEEAFHLAEQANDQGRMGEARRIAGIIFQQTGEYEEALKCFAQARGLFEAVNDRKNLVRVLSGIGIVYDYQGNYDTAMEYYKKALNISEEIEDNLGIAKNSMNIGILYYETKGDYEAGMRYCEKSLQLYKEMDNRLEMARVLNNIGVIYDLQGDYTVAMIHYEHALQIHQELGAKLNIAMDFGNIGFIYKLQGHHDRAITYFDRAIALGRELENRYYLSGHLIDKADALFALQRYAEAQVVNQEGLRIAEDIGRKTYIFQGEVLAAKIDFAFGKQNAACRLEAMLQHMHDHEKLAVLHYELWKMTHCEEHRQTACTLYQTLYANTPNIDYKTRIEEMIKNSH